VIDLGTLSGLLERRYELDAYCSRCDRWQTSPLANLVARGQEARRLPVPVRCSSCRSPGRLQVRPPVPTRRPGGWMEPRQK
jgi:hypothetical protein